MQKKTKKLIVLSNALLFLTAAQAPFADDWMQSSLVQDLMITLAARERMHDEFLKLQHGARLSPLDQSDFLAYIAGLDIRIAVQCGEVLERFSELDPGDLPCTPIAPRPVLPDTAAEQTPDEALAALDSSLTEGLAEFDEMLLSEQKKVAAKAPRASSSTAGYEGAGQGYGSGQQGTAAEGEGSDSQGEEGQNSSGSAKDGGQPRAYGTGAGQRAGRQGPPPEGIPDGSKDDVVARQLREAAEKETDPELKRKLWDEYHRYKSSTH